MRESNIWVCKVSCVVTVSTLDIIVDLKECNIGFAAESDYISFSLDYFPVRLGFGHIYSDLGNALVCRM